MAILKLPQERCNFKIAMRTYGVFKKATCTHFIFKNAMGM